MRPFLLRLALSILVGIAMAIIAGALGAGITAGQPIIGLIAAGATGFILGAGITWRML